MKINTHYDNLKVARDASPEDIKRAFRKLTFQHHPDRNPPEQKALQERRMRIIKEAYDVLSNPKLREEHDAWIKIQESTKNNKRKHEQKGEYDEENTYYHDRGRQEMYYKELLEKERRINLSLRDINTNLEKELYDATTLAQWLKSESNTLKFTNIELTKKNAELTWDNQVLKEKEKTASDNYNKASEKDKKSIKGLRLAAGMLVGIIGIQWANTLFVSTYDKSVLAVLGGNLKYESYMAPPEWKIDDWSDGRFILSKDEEGKLEFINVISKGVVTKKMIMEGLQGRQVGTSDCDKTDALSPINNNKSVRYRFVQLENNTVLSITVPYTHLCKQ